MGNAGLEMIRKMPARSVKDVIGDLHGLVTRQKRGEEGLVPLATFGLRTGQCITGWLVDANLGGHGHPALVVSTPSNNGFLSDTLSYIDPASVQTITLHDLGERAVWFAGGKIDPLETKEAPGKLELDRSLKAISESLSAVLGIALEIGLGDSIDRENALARLVVMETLQVLQGILEELSKDGFALSEIQAKVKAVTVCQGEERGAVLTDGQIKLTLNVVDGVRGRFNASEMREALNAIL